MVARDYPLVASMGVILARSELRQRGNDSHCPQFRLPMTAAARTPAGFQLQVSHAIFSGPRRAQPGSDELCRYAVPGAVRVQRRIEAAAASARVAADRLQLIIASWGIFDAALFPSIAIWPS
jgi:hypothetical protein